MKFKWVLFDVIEWALLSSLHAQTQTQTNPHKCFRTSSGTMRLKKLAIKKVFFVLIYLDR